MKIVILIVLTVSLISAEYVVKTHDDLLQYREDCVRKLNVPASYVVQFKKWDFPNDSTTQCYLQCVFAKFGLFETKTGFDVEKIHQQLVGNTAAAKHDDVAHAKIEGCVDNNEQGSNDCEWAYRGATCFFRENLRLVQQSVVPQA